MRLFYGRKDKTRTGYMPDWKMVMKKEELAPGIVVYKNVIPGLENLHKDIEDSVNANAVSWSPAHVTSGTVYDRVDTSTRDTMTIGVTHLVNPEVDFSSPETTFNTSLSKLFFDCFNPVELDYKNNYGISTDWHESYGILKYGVGQKFTNHIDDHPSYHRRISTVYYMNEDYSGGEINFPRFGISYKPKANEMIVFPSTYVYNHSVEEVTEGTRYAVVSWSR